MSNNSFFADVAKLLEVALQLYESHPGNSDNEGLSAGATIIREFSNMEVLCAGRRLIREFSLMEMPDEGTPEYTARVEAQRARTKEIAAKYNIVVE